MRCPSCKKVEDTGWTERFPKKVAADLSLFIDCSVLFSDSVSIFRCLNCGAYFKRHLNDGEEIVERPELEAALNLVGPELSKVLDLPPDLSNVLTNELRDGNEVDGFTTTADGTWVTVLRYRFMNGHITSSWIEYETAPRHGSWNAWYHCEAVRSAVACLDVPKARN